jgi:hypothetical protein
MTFLERGRDGKGDENWLKKKCPGRGGPGRWVRDSYTERENEIKQSYAKSGFGCNKNNVYLGARELPENFHQISSLKGIF